MDDKKYLDKVVENMVRNTLIKNYLFNPLFRPINRYIPVFSYDVTDDPEETRFILSLYEYLTTQFGLTNDEVKHVFFNYIEVLKDMYDKHNNNKKI